MKRILISLLAAYCTTFAHNRPDQAAAFSIQQQQGAYYVHAKHNAQATPEQKEAFNAQLHQLGGEISEKIKQLILNNKAILDMQGTHPIITLVCQWNNVEVIEEQVKKAEDHSSTTLPSSNAS